MTKKLITLTTKLAMSALSVMLMSGCGGGGGGSSSSPATMNLSVTDTPIMMNGNQVSHVYVQFHGVELQGPTGQTTINFATPKQIDLLAFTGNNAAPLLQGSILPAGNYQWIRLMVDTGGNSDTYVVDSTGSHELTIPSGAETGLKLNQGFTLAQGGLANFTIDFNVAHSLAINSNGYFLKPVLRLVNNEQVGTLTGNVSASLISAHCSNGSTDAGAIYIYSGAGSPPTDISGAVSDPITTAHVATDGTGSYAIGFLQAGSYTAAWTCDESSDDPAVVDTLQFFNPQTLTINASSSTLVNF